MAVVEPKASDVVLQGDTCHRVAENPLKYASVEALLFQELRAPYRPSDKVMFCARGATVHFPAEAPGTPDWATQLQPDAILAACQEAGYTSWRDRVLTPVTTLQLFLLQILHGNTACSHLPHLAGLRFSV